MIEKITSKKTKKNILEKIADIHRQCILKTNSKYYAIEQIEEWLSTVNVKNIKDQLKNTTWVVIEEENHIIGFAQYSIKDKELYQIQIDPLLQGKGWGTKLYKYIESEFKKEKIGTISLYATLNAVPFYEKEDFKIVKNIQFKLVKTKIQMIEMRKVLP